MGERAYHPPLRQQDLSRKRLQEMNTAERAELKRRYDVFVHHFGDHQVPPTEEKRQVRKWIPGERA
jgi:hypothetical protein